MVSQDPRPYDATPDERVATLLAAAAAPAEAGPQPGEEQALAAFRAAPHRTRRIPMTSSPAHRAKLAVAATIGAGTFLFAGVGAAAAGVLPDAAQDTASTVLGQLGFEVPRANDAAGDHPAQRGAEEEADAPETDTDATETDETGTDATETEAADSEADAAEGKGADVSGLATTTDAEGVDKGAEISTYASGGKSRAGADHTAPEPTGADAADGAGDDAADDADVADDGAAEDNDGASASGTDTADEASSGRLAAGSGHRP